MLRESGTRLVDSLSGTSFSIARDAGTYEKGAGSPFERWYVDLQLSNILSAIGHKTYTDEPGPRIQGHVLLGGKRGKGKSSALKQFVQQAIGAIEITERTVETVESFRPTYLTLSGRGSVTYERLRGAITKDGLVHPLLTQVDFLLSPELLSFLDDPQIVNVMSQTIEDGRILIAQMQGSTYTPDEDEMEQWKREGITYSLADKAFSYLPRPTFLGATRDLDEKSKEILDRSGFSDRMLVSNWAPDKNTSRRVWAVQRRTPNEQFAELFRFSGKMRQMAPVHCPRPPSKYVDEALAVMDPIFTAFEEELGLNPDDFRSDRDLNIVYQSLTAACFERMVRTSTSEFDTLEYATSDVEVAKVFATNYANDRTDDRFSTMVATPKSKSLLKEKDEEEGREDGAFNVLFDKYKEKPFNATEASVVTKRGRSQCYAILSNLVKRGVLFQPTRGKFAIVSGTKKLGKGV